MPQRTMKEQSTTQERIAALLQWITDERTVKRIGCMLLAIAVCTVVLDLAFPPRVNVRYSQIVTAADGSVLHAFLSTDDKWRMMTELSEISPALRTAIVYKEDRYFYYHPGVNPFALVRAAYNNIAQGKRTSGASTITMQVVRLLEPRKRTVWNKAIEIFRAWQIEHRYSKDEILQLYLNLVPYGGNIEGVKSASLLYYGRLPNTLSLAQIVALSIIPNRPTSLRIGVNDALLVRERNRWLRRMLNDEVFSEEDLRDAIAEPFDARRYDPPRLAPHYALRLRAMYPGREIIRTRLQPNVQAKVETLAENYMRRLRAYDINNAAILVVDNTTRGVVAYLGSPDFTDREHAGQVDGVRAVRSPGSTLKPLVYAIAIDKGQITPKTVLSDVPVNFNGYAPENFDQKFHGAVTVERALSYSLNIPAVNTLNNIGVLSLIDKLKQANFRQIRKDERNLGLSTILGGCGVRLEELAGLYTAFADAGNYAALQWLQSDTVQTRTRIVSRAASFLITDILTQMARPDFPHSYESSVHIPRVAWKTGTSYGRRDAWSVGYNKRYTVAVWVGNFNGRGVPELTGANIATPLLFDIFNSIDYNSVGEWFSQPKEVDFRLVCAETGLPPNDYCTDVVTDYYLPTISSTRQCQHLKEVFVSADEKISYCRSCVPETGYKKKLYKNLPPELIALYRSEHILFEDIPLHNPNCERVLAEGGPAITSPTAERQYILAKGEEQEILLSATVDNQVDTVYWFINDRLYTRAKAGERVFFKPSNKGRHKISCSDDRGRNSDIWVTVEYE